LRVERLECQLGKADKLSALPGGCFRGLKTIFPVGGFVVCCALLDERNSHDGGLHVIEIDGGVRSLAEPRDGRIVSSSTIYFSDLL
jgi:hypothetical protein